jgi:uncharacterized lipoprotein YddW (UPF0748 family)
MKKWICATIYILLFNILFAQEKYEFRGAWIATIGGIDWPKPITRKNLDQQKQDLVNILDSLKRLNFNAVVFQVRPTSDAFYKSSFEPWSFYLTGELGKDPGYDPLGLIIAECHKRGMELHAWFNPFRTLVDVRKNKNPANHYSKTHPEWCVNYGGKRYIDPGIPEARAYVIRVISEVVSTYDIDAVHMDDYFYPYRVGKYPFPDQKSYAQYGQSMFSVKDDWRRDNVNSFVRNLSKEIKRLKPQVKFGISPFGIWRNMDQDPEGSRTHGGSNYDELYADIRLWLQQGWIDYVMPQLYWERGHRSADFTTLLDWWSKNTYGRHLYIGHGIYRIGTDRSSVWRNSYRELYEQIEDSRKMDNVEGGCMYSMDHIIKDRLGMNITFRELYAKPAIIKPMPWLSKTVPIAPIAERSALGYLLKSLTPRIAVYRNGELLEILQFKEGIALPLSYKGYQISGLDRWGQESALVDLK